MPHIDELQQRFALSDKLSFILVGENQPALEINTPLCTARVVLQGAHLCEWTPVNEKPVIWLSEQASFMKGRSIRGGIPVCWPWFGAHPTQSDFPAHGFARTVDWQLVSTGLLADGRVELVFELAVDPDNRDALSEKIQYWWPYQTPVSLRMTLGQTLELALETRNAGTQPVTITEALHTYFAVSDITQTRVTGLAQCDYLDKVKDFARFTQQGDIEFNGEVDRVYLDTTANCLIHDPAWQRTIQIEKQNSQSTVVWNPWRDTALAMGDMGEAGYRQMLCVETANAASNKITLQPGESHRLWVSYQVLSS